MKRWILVISASVLGLFLLSFKNENIDESVGVIVLQFVMLVLFGLITLSWVSRYIKFVYINWLFAFVGIMNLAIGIFVFLRFLDGYISLPFFLIASYSFFKVK